MYKVRFLKFFFVAMFYNVKNPKIRILWIRFLSDPDPIPIPSLNGLLRFLNNRVIAAASLPLHRLLGNNEYVKTIDNLSFKLVKTKYIKNAAFVTFLVNFSHFSSIPIYVIIDFYLTRNIDLDLDLDLEFDLNSVKMSLGYS